MRFVQLLLDELTKPDIELVLFDISQPLLNTAYQHALDTVLRFARHKFGELGDSILLLLPALTLDQLDALIEALFDMQSRDELIDWLKSQPKS